MILELGLGGIVGFGVAWVLRPYLSAYVAKKGENLATKEDIGGITKAIEEVKLQYARQAEEIRAELNSMSHERHTRFASLHEKRVEAIDGLYSSLRRTHAEFTRLAGPMRKFEDENFEELLKTAGPVAEDLIKFFSEKRLYFPKVLIESFAKLEEHFHSAWVTFLYERTGDDWSEVSIEERKEQMGYWREAREGIRVKVPELLEEIESIMRQVLGDSESRPGSERDDQIRE